MQNNDGFDDPESAGVFAGIVRALDVRSHFAARRPLWAAGLVVATLAVLGAVLFYTYPRAGVLNTNDIVPIIRADAQPLKAAPEEPGGMDIPHRESVVFDTLNDGGERRVESLLPAAEEPLPRDELFAGLKTEIPEEVADAAAAIAASEEGGEETDETALETAAVTLPKPDPFPAPGEEEATAAPTDEDANGAAATEPAAGLALAAKEVGAGTHYVQLASVRDEAAAKAEWKKMQAANDVLAPLTLRLQRADLGARGVFYRIQAGPVPEAEARQICKAMDSKRPGGCLVVKP